MQEVKIYYKDEKKMERTIYSKGFVYYTRCEICGWETQRYFENLIHGVVPCDQCSSPVMYNYHQQILPGEAFSRHKNEN